MSARAAAAVVVLVLGLCRAEAVAGLSQDEAILPVGDYRSPDMRALAAAHLQELGGLYDDVRRCVSELDFQLDGIAFRRPHGNPEAAPHLTLWVWTDPDRPPGGTDLGSRAAEVFRQYARRLLRLMRGRAPVFADSRVRGYGLILTWFPKGKKVGGAPVGESLVLFADKLAVVELENGTLLPTGFLARAQVRLFDGRTEVSLRRLTVSDVEAAPAFDDC